MDFFITVLKMDQTGPDDSIGNWELVQSDEIPKTSQKLG